MPEVASADGTPIRYYDFGGSGPDLLLLHATGFHARVWRAVAEQLADVAHCWALDLRGHGDSGVRADLDFAWRGFAEDVEAVLGVLDLDRPYAVGHSLGGAILLMVEARHPGTFRSIYVYEPAIFVPTERRPDDGTSSVQLALKRRPTFPSRHDAFANYANKPPMDAFDHEVLADYVDHGFTTAEDGSVTLKCRPEYEAGTFGGFAGSDSYRHLDEVACPVVLASGSESLGRDASRDDTLSDRLVQSSRVVLPGLNHFGPQQDPSVLAASVRTSLLGLPA